MAAYYVGTGLTSALVISDTGGVILNIIGHHPWLGAGFEANVCSTGC